jgi:serine/threonine kinase 16
LASDEGPFAHRDVKPGNVMIADDGSPILMDFGSLAPARIPIRNRMDAIRVQEEAAEHSTLPYRAPELFDCETGTIITEKSDIWSFGATLYACMYGYSPFEGTVEQNGGALALAIANAQYKFPDGRYSQELQGIVKRCLLLEADARPSAHDLVEMVDRLCSDSGR